MKTFKSVGLLALVGMATAGCMQGTRSADNPIWVADRALTMYEPPSSSPYRGAKTARCPEWQRVMSQRNIDADNWKFGCVSSASLVVSVNDKRDLSRGRTPRPSDGWEAYTTHTKDVKGEFDPGQTDTSKSSTSQN